MRHYALRTSTKNGYAYFYRKINNNYSVTFSLEMAKVFATYELVYEFKYNFDLIAFEIIELTTLSATRRIENVE